MSESKNLVQLADITVDLPASNVIDRLYTSLSELVKGEKLTTENAMQIALNLMKIVETYPDLHGRQKKALVLYVLKRFVRENMDGDEEKDLLTFIDLFLPTVIDTIIYVDKKEIAIKIKKGFKACFPFVKKISAPK